MIFEYFEIVRLLSSLNIWFFVRILIRRNVEIYYLLESSEYLLDFDPNIFRYSIIYIRVFEYLPSSRYANIRMQPVPEFVLWRVFRLLGYSIAISSLFLIYIKYCMLHTHTTEGNPAFEARGCQESLTYRFLVVGRETKRLLSSLFFPSPHFILTFYLTSHLQSYNVYKFQAKRDIVVSNPSLILRVVPDAIHSLFLR